MRFLCPLQCWRLRVLPLSKCGNAGRIAQWILEEIEDPLDYWCHGKGVTSAKLVVKLAIGDTVVTLENKWWGVRGSVIAGHRCDPLLDTWFIRRVWAPAWLRESFSLGWGTKVKALQWSGLEPFIFDEDRASGMIRAAMPHKVY